MQSAIPSIQWTISLGSILIASSLLAAAVTISKVAKSVISPIRQFISEHDVLWEDYNIRTGGSFRRNTGRGDPPEPEDFYKTHHEEA
jgi:hypothetical protein